MFRKFVCLVVLVVFSSTALFAQTSAQISQIEKYLDSPQGRKFLESAEGKKLIEKYSGKGLQIKEEAGYVAEKKEEIEKEREKEIEMGIKEEKEKEIGKERQVLSKLELALSADLLLEGKEPLRQYGYDVFKSTVATFTPPQDVPVGPDYIVGPGDSFNVTLWGITEGIFKVKVNREGDIVLPKVGVVKVAGLTYGELKPFIEQQLGKYYESVNVGITIDQLRTIRVYVVGEVSRPGSYSVSSLSTVYSALFAAGGPTKMGTLRNVQLIRGGVTIANLDLYRFLLKGDKSQDRELQSGDTVFVPVIGPVVGIAGAVYRPAIYEIKGKADLADLIHLAGGFLPTSYLNRVQVKRVVAHEKRVIRDENVTQKRSFQSFGLTLKNMDLVEVLPLYKEIRNLVYLEGAVKYPGSFEYKEGMRIKDILPSMDAFTPGAYLPRVEVIRVDPDTRKISIRAVDFEKLYAGDSSQNITLRPLDQIVVSSEKVKLGKITLSGEVKRPGVYTFTPGERLSSVLKRAGGFTPNAYLFGAVFRRKSAQKMQVAQTEKLIEKLQEDVLRRGQEIVSGALTEAQRAAREIQLQKAEQLLRLFKEKIVVEGRVIVRLQYPLEEFEKSENDLELEDGDSLDIPAVSKIVNVLGEVYQPSSVVYNERKKVSYYLHQVGGATPNADLDSIYIIRADGSVLSRKQGYNILSVTLNPGDSVVVPQLIEKFNWWVSLKDWTHWFYEAALAFAVIATYLKQ